MKHNSSRFGRNRRGAGLAWGLALAVLLNLCLPGSAAASDPAKIPTVPKWGRFDQPFKSSLLYSNPVQEASLAVEFISPSGETSRVDGFWDGGKIWRVRFSPSEPGLWSYRTLCSDPANLGLHNQSGQLLCTAPTGQTRYSRHGWIQVARDGRHFEHEDRTPFLWLADTAWSGPRSTPLKQWKPYAGTRAQQQFNTVQWAVCPGADEKGQGAYGGYPDRIVINPEFFKRLDAKVDALSWAGLLSAIAPVAPLDSGEAGVLNVSESQLLVLVRYIVARYQAEPVAWLLPVGGASPKVQAQWKKIGQTLFAGRRHAPVVLSATLNPEVLEAFRDQPWVDAFQFRAVSDVTDSGVLPALKGPFARHWTNAPIRPLLWELPRENGVSPRPPYRFSPEDVRRAAYLSLMIAPPTGLAYSANGIANWDGSVDPAPEKIKGADLPMWRKALFLPGARQMTCLTRLVAGMDLAGLQPGSEILTNLPERSPKDAVIALSTPQKDLILVYSPVGGKIELPVACLPRSPFFAWFNPRTGESSPSYPQPASGVCSSVAPAPGDWVFLIKQGR